MKGIGEGGVRVGGRGKCGEGELIYMYTYRVCYGCILTTGREDIWSCRSYSRRTRNRQDCHCNGYVPNLSIIMDIMCHGGHRCAHFVWWVWLHRDGTGPWGRHTIHCLGRQ